MSQSMDGGHAVDNSPAARHTNAPYSPAPLKIIKEIQFGLFSPEEIAAMSVVEVKYPETMVGCVESPDMTRWQEQDETGTHPKEGGLGDQKMGSIDRAFKCSTCNHDADICPGHFGHIELKTPVFHPG
jgi:DNA-directed RNA polymerase II subunit RPB1